MSLAMDCLERLPVHAAGLATCQCQILRFGNGALAIDWVKDKVTKAHAVLLRERGGSGTRLAAELTVCGLSAGEEWIRTCGSAILIMQRKTAFLRRISARQSEDLVGFRRTPRFLHGHR
jgi:hypothetical protein